MIRRNDFKVLLVEDERDTRELLELGLENRGLDVLTADSAEAAIRICESETVDVVVTDIRLGGMDGLTLCRAINSIENAPAVIVMTAYGETDVVVEAMRSRAYDFVVKPVRLDELEVLVRRAGQDHRLQERVEELAELETARAEHPLVGQSAAIERVRQLIDGVASSNATVLVSGESGTGKELVARAVHDKSGLPGRFLAVNCAAMPAPLLESELFGHRKGAFTGARGSREGLFVAAHGGTLFLDEIGEMPLEMQVRLLRALQEKKVRPVGSDTEHEAAPRVIAATNKDIEKELERGSFREDLYYRINVVNIPVPPLRERGNDILILAQHFVRRAANRLGREVEGISSDVASKLLDYSWPGNVRELQNAIERGVTLARQTEVCSSDLPPQIQSLGSPSTPFLPEVELITLEEVEKRYIEHVLDVSDGNKTRAVQVLGMDRRTLYRRMDALGIAKTHGSSRPPREAASSRDSAPGGPGGEGPAAAPEADGAVPVMSPEAAHVSGPTRPRRQTEA